MRTRTPSAIVIAAMALAATDPAPARFPGAIVGEIPLPAPHVTGMAGDGKALWVADRKADVIYSLDPSTGSVKAEIPSPGFRPVGIASDGDHLWVADIQSAKAFRIETATGKVTREIPLPGAYPQGLAHDGTHLWIADRGEGKIFRISTTDGTIVKTIAEPAKGVTGLAWLDGWLWAAGRLDDEIYRIDPDRGLVVGVLPSPGPHPWGLAPAPGGEDLLVADCQDGKIEKVALSGGDDPWVRRDPKEYVLDFTDDVWNYGKDSLDTVSIHVALPVDGPGQEILDGPTYGAKPLEVVENSVGQGYARWLFEKLAAPGRATVQVSWKVRLFRADWFIDPREVGSSIPKEVKQVWLADAEKYLTGDPYIKKVVAAVVGGEKNPYWKARLLYEWEIDKLDYKLAGGHENAPNVLQRGNGSCSEYTFSFISLCRAAGVPARFVGSVVVRKDDASEDDVFHRWAEIYLPPYGWVPVDVNHGDKPTPRERALGFGHLTNNLLVTTIEGPVAENPLGWGYNSAAEWTYSGTAKVYEEPIADWMPLAP